MKRIIYIALLTVFAVSACDFLEPLPDGSYNEENYTDYPTIIRGYIDKAYNLRPSSYHNTEYMGTDAASDDMMYRNKAGDMRQLSIGNAQMSKFPLLGVWERDYKAIYYVNLFLKDDIGRKTRYLVDPESNAVLQRCLQGDAFGLRAWYAFNLLEFWGGEGTDGKLLGVYIPTKPFDIEKDDLKEMVRPSYDDCVKQILADCDSALKYLPPANRDQYLQGESFHVTGAIRYRALDGAAIKALKARILLTWASPAFNPSGDVTRWEKAARAAALEEATLYAASVPLRTMEASLKALPLALEMAQKGNPASASDAGVAALAAVAGIRGAALNVRINAAGLTDKAPAEPLLARADSIVAEALALQDAVLAAVNSHIDN